MNSFPFAKYSHRGPHISLRACGKLSSLVSLVSPLFFFLCFSFLFISLIWRFFPLRSYVLPYSEGSTLARSFIVACRLSASPSLFPVLEMSWRALSLFISSSKIAKSPPPLPPHPDTPFSFSKGRDNRLLAARERILLPFLSSSFLDNVTGPPCRF